MKVLSSGLSSQFGIHCQCFHNLSECDPLAVVVNFVKA